MGILRDKLGLRPRVAAPQQAASRRIPSKLLEYAPLETAAVLQRLETSLSGLSVQEHEKRLGLYGLNEVAQEKQRGFLMHLWENIKNPLVILLSVLAVISLITGDLRAAVVISVMVVLGVVLRFVQEMRADQAAATLKAMVSTTATVIRAGEQQEIALRELVPGDIVVISAGDMVPADVRLISAKDLFVNQAALTGESMPVEKFPNPITTVAQNPLELNNVCFLGSNVESGSGTAVVVLTGSKTFFGDLAASIIEQNETSSFDKGINSFTWLMIRFILIMVPLVFLFNGLSKHNWLEAFLFAMSVAVGLTPEMLPMIVTVNLSKGALMMSRRKVIVKRLNAIQNLGAMDVLCTDKTGTLTEGRIVLEKYINVHGDTSDKVLHYAYINSFYQTGLKNLLDVAVLNHVDLEEQIVIRGEFQKLDEIPFDFARRRMSVVVEDANNNHLLICKGAVEEIMALCTRVEVNGEVLNVLPLYDDKRRARVHALNDQGFRVIALAYKLLPNTSHKPTYSVQDESDLVLMGFLAFLDPPKQSAKEAIRLLQENHVDTKILTGDNEVVTASICRQVGMPTENILMGAAIDDMSDIDLADAAEKTTIFAKLSPTHKKRIIHALKAKGHVVGFMGDGINDAPALKAADVGISVNTAVDIAKESSDIILLENDLLVLRDGVVEGRRVFGNITKYIRMAASSNFGNMFSVLGGSLFLPFIPMLPIQVLTNNLLYDLSQTTIPTDNVDAGWLSKPRKWTMGSIQRFILFIGPISSIFDYMTFFIMLYVFKAWNNPALFHTGWFIESLFTQTLIIHVIRTNKIPFIQSRASLPLLLTSVAIVAVGALLTISPLAPILGFVALPPLYWLLLAGMLVLYVVLTQLVKTWFYKRFGE